MTTEIRNKRRSTASSHSAEVPSVHEVDTPTASPSKSVKSKVSAVSLSNTPEHPIFTEFTQPSQEATPLLLEKAPDTKQNVQEVTLFDTEDTTSRAEAQSFIRKAQPEKETMAAVPVGIMKTLPPVAVKGPQPAVLIKEKGNVTVSEFPVDEESSSSEEKTIVRKGNTTVTTTTTEVSSSGTLTRTTTNGSIHPESRVSEVVQYVKGLFSKLGDYEVNMLRQADLESYLRYIADERLIHMPRKGSDWDRVLRTAQFFGLQIWRFGEKVGKFAPESREAAGSALASCTLLLEVRNVLSYFRYVNLHLTISFL